MKDKRFLDAIDHVKAISHDLHHLENVLSILHVGFENYGLDATDAAMSTTYVVEKFIDLVDKKYIEPLEKLLCRMCGMQVDDEEDDDIE